MARFPRRLTLKALLLLTAAVAIVCAIEVQRWRYRKRLIQTIAQYRGFPQTNTVGPEWLRSMVDDREAFEEVEGIVFGPASPYFEVSNRLKDAELKAALAPLSSNAKLEFIELSHTAVSDRSLDTISRLCVAKLSLNHTGVTDEAVRRIAKFDSLSVLGLDNTKVTDDSLQALAEMPRLRMLKIQGTLVTDIGLDHLAKSTSLTTLVIRDTKVTAEGVARFRESLPNCRVISDY